MKEDPIKYKCPVCNKPTLKLKFREVELAYFGEVLEIFLVCEECGFKSIKTIPKKIDKPKRYSVEVVKEEDLEIKVVKSGTSTIKIPELGVEIIPGPDSQYFITNIEGILNRILEIGKEKIKDKIEKIKMGKMKITFILEDPYGVGKLIGKKVKEEIME